MRIPVVVSRQSSVISHQSSKAALAARSLYDARELLGLPREELRKPLGRARDHRHAVVGKPVRELWKLQYAHDFGIELDDRIARRRGGHQQAVPVGHVVSLETRLRNGRDVRGDWRALGRRDAQRAQLARSEEHTSELQSLR